jgi:hypothetical protein
MYPQMASKCKLPSTAEARLHGQDTKGRSGHKMATRALPPLG